MKGKKRIAALIGVILITILLTTVVTAETVIPSERAYVSLAYASKSKQVVLFGGQNPGNPFSREIYTLNGETWTYSVVKESWTQLFPKPAPSSRTGQELDYDAESDRVIMFGGCHQYWIGYGCENDETFVFDPKKITWKRMSDGPKGSLGARMVYDAESDRMILFGGLDFRAWVYFSGTYAYDYNTDTWTEMTPSLSPPGRNFQAMTYDAKADRVLTWGGMYPDDSPLPESVWAYDYNTNTWEERVPVGDYPKSRDYAQMAYDSESDITILFGGLPMAYPDGSIDLDVGTWAYDYNTNTFQKMNPVIEPPSISRHAMVYVKDIDRIILFGGETADGIDYNFSNEFWMYDYNTNTWTDLNP